MASDSKPGLFTRLLEFLHLRKPPPDIGVREPRRPTPAAPGGAATVDPAETEERD